MKLGDGVEQAIHCMLMLSGLQPDGAMPAAALAEYHGVSTSYLLKHLQALAGAGLLTSVPGPRGGYRLGRLAEKITLLDVVLALEGAGPAFRCSEIRQRGPDPLPQKFFAKPCAVTAAMLKAERAYRDELRKVSIAELAYNPDTELGNAIAGRSCAFRERHERRPAAS
ncbi:Rrf2 family transcriptional regulator [Devosia sp. Root413D1]|uniref:RrF2 family transcriptional regulator n=1 Tax=Devosia sp. Root413D1 TaxID=1736531 RepID=UPI0006F3DF06|nr:Rrf2 family transcriptional regulator [Devosia sp. Root413D1]KQW79281.1 Rrf2 family transcriptional regulator [Devosia sp. Root413D1]